MDFPEKTYHQCQTDSQVRECSGLFGRDILHERNLRLSTCTYFQVQVFVQITAQILLLGMVVIDCMN